MRGDSSALDNDAKIGAFLVLRSTVCGGCGDESMLADRAASALAEARGRTEERYLVAFLSVLEGGDASHIVERSRVRPSPDRQVRGDRDP